MEKNSNATSRILNQMNEVDADMFSGVWTAEIAHDGIVDNYTLTFGESHKIEVEVTSVNKKGVESTASGKGRYNWNDNEKILSVTVNTMSGNIKHIKNVVWKTMVNPSDDEASFNCVVPITYNNKSQNMRVTFYQD
ncbi:MAG: hypothetical protein J6Y01_00210 [Spirochaetales bacterium]|nr:hypothetical protein [Spirochaetales bacterium]